MSLQYVRAIGVIFVVLWHTKWTKSFVGQSGVDLFFVVSGFVMMLVSGREQSPLRFTLARWTRIVPLYWVITLCVVSLCMSLSQPPVPNLLSSLLFWPDQPFPVLIQGWSLNLEMAYYLLFALALFGPSRWRLPILAAEFLVLCVGLPAVLPPSVTLQNLANPLAFEFLAGACLYEAWVRRIIPTGASAWLILVVGTSVLLGTHLIGGAPAGWARVGTWGVPALAIVMASLGIERSGQLPRIPVLQAIGEASYSTYLTHFVVITFLSEPLHQFWAPLSLSVMLLCSCLVGWAIYWGVELPLHRLSKWLMRSIRTRQVAPV